jgi:hypothetical protein
MTVIDWTEFGGANGDYPEPFKFLEVGDAIAGEITQLSIATMPDGTRIPSLYIRIADGTIWSVLASQRQLQGLLASNRPATGDRVAIVMTGLGEAKPGKSPAKLFELQLKRGDETGTPAVVPAPAPAAPVAAVVSAADLI